MQAEQIERIAIGAACAIFDESGRVLLVHHTYGRLNWELPGGGAEPGEAPGETARRELLEETGLVADATELSGIYFESDHERGPMIHFVFRCPWVGPIEPRVASREISEARFWPLDELPAPISDFTERRIQDATRKAAPQVVRIAGRKWRNR